MAKWSAVLVAVIGAAGVLGAAAIGLLKSDNAPGADDPALSTSAIQILHKGSGEIIDVEGRLSGKPPLRADIYAFARPEDQKRVVNDPTALWYVGGPAVLSPDGSWRADIIIAPGENRALSVSAALIPVVAPAPAATPGKKPDSGPTLEQVGPQSAVEVTNDRSVSLQS